MDNVRTLDFSKDQETQLMPEDIFEGTAEELGADFFTDAVPQFAEEPEEGTLVVGDFTASIEDEPLTAVELMHSRPFFYLQIPSLGIEVPLEVDVATSLFDSLGAAINGL